MSRTRRYVYSVETASEGHSMALPIGESLKGALATARRFSATKWAGDPVIYLKRAISFNRGLNRGEYERIAKFRDGRKVG